MPRRPPRTELHTAPHVIAGASASVAVIMRNVVYALLPLVAYAVWLFGLSTLALIVVVLVSVLLTERLLNWMSTENSSLNDWSAVITGLLLGLTLPPGFPLWMGAVAGFVSIALGKALFGGLGFNVLNPALVGRAFVQAAFPVAITTWVPPLAKQRFIEFIPSTLTPPFMEPVEFGNWLAVTGVDTFTGATPLALQKFQGVATSVDSMFMGAISGSAGETSVLLILICGAYLAVRRMLDWRIPVTIFVSVAITSQLLHWFNPSYPAPLFMLFSGGLMLGAVFMATDMVGSPVTPRGVLVFGLLIGFLTVIIRVFGSLSEGVMYAILLGNAATPLIELVTQPRTLGQRQEKDDG